MSVPCPLLARGKGQQKTFKGLYSIKVITGFKLSFYTYKIAASLLDLEKLFSWKGCYQVIVQVSEYT